jgi:hypothetical protein
MMRPRMARVLVGGVLALFACTTTPTSLCGCPPSRSTVLVGGTVLDAGGAPVSGARLYLDGAPRSGTGQSAPQYLDSAPSATTDATGSFRALVYSPYSPGILELRAAVMRPGVADTVRLVVGLASFHDERTQPDSIYATLRLP